MGMSYSKMIKLTEECVGCLTCLLSFVGVVHVLSLSWFCTCPFTFLVLYMSFHFPGLVHVLSLSWFCTCTSITSGEAKLFK